MTETLLIYLKKAFDVREGEILRVSLMQLNIFLIVSTLLIVKPTVNGLFLSEMGVKALPAAYLLVAVFAIIISMLYARFLGNVGLNRILIGTLSFSSLLFILFGLLLRLDVVGGWTLYAFYIWVAIFGVLTASQFWILANMVFNAREAKRLFGFIGAGAIAGGIFGGYLTTLLAEVLGSENLPFVAASLLMFCIPLTIYTWKNFVVSSQSTFQQNKKITRPRRPLQIILKTSHLTYLAGIIGISVIVAKLVDYQFSAIAAAKIEDPDELTAFFGFWFSNFNVISLTIQLVLTRRVVGTFGVGTSLLFLPGAILLGAFFVFFIPSLWAAIFIKMSDGSLKQSINKAAVELLALPIPTEIKRQTKTFIDVVVDSIATGISGVILIFLINGLDLSTRAVSVMTAGLILLWLFFVSKVRKSYLESFLINVQKAHQSGEKRLDLKKDSVVSGLKKVLSKGSEGQIMAALRKLNAQPDQRFADALQLLLKHPSDRVKVEAIHNLYFLKYRTFIDQVHPLTKYPRKSVKIAAFNYLIARSPEQSVDLMETFLNDGDHKVRTAALINLAEESQDNPVLKSNFQLEKRLQAAYYDLGNVEDPIRRDYYKIGLLKALGLAKIPAFFPFIEEFFQDKNLKVARRAILAAGETMHPHFLPFLINYLGSSSVSESARYSLLKYGEGIVNVLARYTDSPDAKLSVLQQLTSVVEHFGTQPAADLLFGLLPHPDAKVRLSALRSINRLKISHPYLNFHEKQVLPHLFKEAQLYEDTLAMLYIQLQADSLQPFSDEAAAIQSTRLYLIQILEKRLDHSLERIFRLLGLKYPPTDVISVYQSIQSKQPDLRANAIEYLDNLLDKGLKKVLMPIVETALLDNITEEAIRDMNLKIPDEMECYQSLLKSGDEEVRMAVRALMDQVRAPDKK